MFGNFFAKFNYNYKFFKIELHSYYTDFYFETMHIDYANVFILENQKSINFVHNIVLFQY